MNEKEMNTSKEANKIRNEMLDDKEKMLDNSLEEESLNLLSFVNAIIKKKFPKRSFLSYLPLFEDIHYDRIKLTPEEYKYNENEILKLKKKVQAKLFHKKFILKEINEKIEQYDHFFEENKNNVRPQLKEFFNVELTDLKLQTKNSSLRVQMHEYVINEKLKNWLELYKELSNAEIDTQIKKRKIELLIKLNLETK